MCGAFSYLIAELYAFNDEFRELVMSNFVTADELKSNGYINRGYWFVHSSELIGINLSSNTIRGYKPEFVIERKDNNVTLQMLEDLVLCLSRLRQGV